MLRKFIAFSILLAIAISCTKTEDVVDYSATDKKIIEDYLVAHDLTAQSTASGLYYIIHKPGGELHPTLKSLVSVNYKGYLTDETVFDSSYPKGAPVPMALKSVVAGWQEGLPFIGAGGEIQLFIPSALGYGTTAQTKTINGVVQTIVPANSVLIFDIGLVDFY